MKITLTKNSEDEVVIDPDTEVLKRAYDTIKRWHLDDLVTKALRRTGYGGDFFGLTYPDDLDDDDRQTISILEGYVRVDFYKDQYMDLLERDYLNLLRQVCLLNGLDERAELLKRFVEDSSIAEDMVEANAEASNARWKRTIPFLLKNGWTIEDGMVGVPVHGTRFSAEHFSGDLNVLFRKSKRVVERNEIKKHKNQAYVEAHRLMMKSLSEFFEQEGDEARNPPSSD